MAGQNNRLVPSCRLVPFSLVRKLGGDRPFQLHPPLLRRGRRIGQMGPHRRPLRPRVYGWIFLFYFQVWSGFFSRDKGVRAVMGEHNHLLDWETVEVIDDVKR